MREWFEWVNDEHMSAAVWKFQKAGVLPAMPFKWRVNPHDLSIQPLPNVWLGVSAEDHERAELRIPDLLNTPAAVRFVSYEPALGPIDFTRLRDDELGAKWNALASGLDWIIVGGESGPRARRFHLEWARSVVKQCAEAKVACFVKQLGADPHVMPPHCRGWVPVKLKSRKGNDMLEWPADLRVRQFPKLDASAA